MSKAILAAKYVLLYTKHEYAHTHTIATECNSIEKRMPIETANKTDVFGTDNLEHVSFAQ